MPTITTPHLTRARAIALAYAADHTEGRLPTTTHPRVVATLLSYGWVALAQGHLVDLHHPVITDAGRTAIGEPTLAAVADQAARSAADQAAHTDGCRSWIDGDPYCDCADDQAATDQAATPTHGTRGRLAATLIGVTATRPNVVIGYDVDPDDEMTGRALCRAYADETGEPVAVYAVPPGDDQAATYARRGPVAALPYVGTFQPTVTGPCWDGRWIDGHAPDACHARATTTVPASVWAPGQTTDYPANVPACTAHARAVWDADDQAAQRAEMRATSADYLT